MYLSLLCVLLCDVYFKHQYKRDFLKLWKLCLNFNGVFNVPFLWSKKEANQMTTNSVNTLKKYFVA